MSKYVQGILGPFSGKVGPVVGSKWNGRFVMRGRPYPKQQITPSVFQQVQRQKFGTMAKYMRVLAGMVRVGFQYAAKTAAITARNMAMKVNMDNAMNLNASNIWEIIPSAVATSRGSFANVESLAMTLNAGGTGFNVSWTDNAGMTIGQTSSGQNVVTRSNDKIYLVLVNTTKNEADYSNFAAANRDDASAVFTKPAHWSAGDAIHLYAFAVPNLVEQYKSGDLTMTDEQRQQAEEMMNEGFGVSDSLNVNLVLS